MKPGTDCGRWPKDRQQEHEWRRLYDGVVHLLRAIDSGEASFSGPDGQTFSDLSRAIERINPDTLPRREGQS